MASEEVSGKREQIKLPHLPDYLVNFVDFKREMVRLDYTAEQLRRACQEVQERRVRVREGLRRDSDEVVSRAHACHQRQLRDDEETLELQKRARLVAERKRILQLELQTSRTLYHELMRKRAKLQHWLNDLEEHRSFLSEIIAHKVSPRTPRSSRPPLTSRDDGDDQIAQVMQNPGLIRTRLEHKERNVIAQSRMVYQACQLMDRCYKTAGIKHDKIGEPSGEDDDDDTLEQLKPNYSLPGAKGGGLQTALNDQIFANIHRLFKKFIAPKSSSCDALANFAALERYAYYVLQMVDTCEPTMLKKIIAKVIVDKKKSIEMQRIRKDTAHREERERKAQANATSAPAVFQRVTVVGPNRLRRVVRGSALNRPTTATRESKEVEAAPEEELFYLFRLQM